MARESRLTDDIHTTDIINKFDATQVDNLDNGFGSVQSKFESQQTMINQELNRVLLETEMKLKDL